MNNDFFLWTEIYRPKTVEECILPPSMKKTFQSFVDDGAVPNLLLTGRSGVGKTTVARAMLEQLGCDYIVINGSLNGNIDTLRNDISNFASAVSLSGGRKYVVLDEADYLNANSTQPALRNFMEEYSKNCGFILTCNFKNRIIDPLHSRCSVVEFKIENADKPSIAAQFFKRACSILEHEKVAFDKQVVAELIKLYFPDWRRVINELQRYSATGRIDTGILTDGGSDKIKTLLGHLKDKKFNDVRAWIGENGDIETSTLYRKIYDMSPSFVDAKSIPQLILILADYQHRAAFVADHEINNVACCVEIMANVTFK